MSRWAAAMALAAVTAALALSAAGALRCWRCGQYSDGVGSITPCTNHTGAKLGDCLPEHKYCIKYVSELTTVRDCVPTCTEKEWWGARTYCCDADECNSATGVSASGVMLASLLGGLLAGGLAGGAGDWQ